MSFYPTIRYEYADESNSSQHSVATDPPLFRQEHSQLSFLEACNDPAMQSYPSSLLLDDDHLQGQPTPISQQPFSPYANGSGGQPQSGYSIGCDPSSYWQPMADQNELDQRHHHIPMSTLNSSQQFMMPPVPHEQQRMQMEMGVVGGRRSHNVHQMKTEYDASADQQQQFCTDEPFSHPIPLNHGGNFENLRPMKAAGGDQRTQQQQRRPFQQIDNVNAAGGHHFGGGGGANSSCHEYYGRNAFDEDRMEHKAEGDDQHGYLDSLNWEELEEPSEYEGEAEQEEAYPDADPAIGEDSSFAADPHIVAGRKESAIGDSAKEREHLRNQQQHHFMIGPSAAANGHKVVIVGGGESAVMDEDLLKAADDSGGADIGADDSAEQVKGPPIAPNGFVKPAYSYSCLIGLSLKNSVTGELTVSEIYTFLCFHFPYFREAPSGWKNSVRHNLSLNKCFQKIEVEAPGSHGRKSCLWKMNPQKRAKMDQELRKWRERDEPRIRNAMEHPENLDALQGGSMGMPPNMKPRRFGVPATVGMAVKGEDCDRGNGARGVRRPCLQQQQPSSSSSYSIPAADEPQEQGHQRMPTTANRHYQQQNFEQQQQKYASQRHFQQQMQQRPMSNSPSAPARVLGSSVHALAARKLENLLQQQKSSATAGTGASSLAENGTFGGFTLLDGSGGKFGGGAAKRRRSSAEIVGLDSSPSASSGGHLSRRTGRHSGEHYGEQQNQPPKHHSQQEQQNWHGEQPQPQMGHSFYQHHQHPPPPQHASSASSLASSSSAGSSILLAERQRQANAVASLYEQMRSNSSNSNARVGTQNTNYSEAGSQKSNIAASGILQNQNRASEQQQRHPSASAMMAPATQQDQQRQFVQQRPVAQVHPHLRQNQHQQQMYRQRQQHQFELRRPLPSLLQRNLNPGHFTSQQQQQPQQSSLPSPQQSTAAGGGAADGANGPLGGLDSCESALAKENPLLL